VPELPASVARHFTESPDLADPCARAAVVARLLEDGDRADLRWLAAHIPDSEITAWFERHGARRLSRRSRAFWAVVFDSGRDSERGSGRPDSGREREPADDPTRPAADSFWPLA
jgi:hypothetical protein